MNNNCAGLKWPLVLVRWVDSTSPRMGWVSLSSWEGVGSLECVSVGFLIAEDQKSKTIAPHLAYPDDNEQCQGNGIIVIPLPAIISIEDLLTGESAYAARDHFFDRPKSVLPSV